MKFSDASMDELMGSFDVLDGYHSTVKHERVDGRFHYHLNYEDGDAGIIYGAVKRVSTRPYRQVLPQAIPNDEF